MLPPLRPASAARRSIPPLPQGARIAVALFSGLSDDFMGDMLRHTLEASGVDYSPSTRAPLPTTLAFVRLEGGQARYTFTMRIAPAEC